MDIYRITQTGATRRVRYGTKRQAAAVAGSVKSANRSVHDGVEWARKHGRPGFATNPEPFLTHLTVERAPVGEFTDVTAEFLIGLKDRIKDQLKTAYAIGFFHGDDDGEAGDHEPRGGSPDRTPPGAARISGTGGQYLSIETLAGVS